MPNYQAARLWVRPESLAKCHEAIGRFHLYPEILASIEFAGYRVVAST